MKALKKIDSLELIYMMKLEQRPLAHFVWFVFIR